MEDEGKEAPQRDGRGSIELIEQTQSQVDWQAIEDRLSSIPDAFKQPHFESLPHVIEALNSHNPEAALDQLRGARDAILGLVDEVVQGNHYGFNKAIQNYSQILRLFSECQEAVMQLKVDLNEARRRIVARSYLLQTQWCSDITLSSVVRLLDQVAEVSAAPARLKQLAARGEFRTAVGLLKEVKATLSIDDMQKMAALDALRGHVDAQGVALRDAVVKKLCDLVLEGQGGGRGGWGGGLLGGGQQRRLGNRPSSPSSPRSLGGSSSPVSVAGSEGPTTPSLRLPSSEAIAGGEAAARLDGAEEWRRAAGSEVEELVACLALLREIPTARRGLQLRLKEDLARILREDVARVGAEVTSAPPRPSYHSLSGRSAPVSGAARRAPGGGGAGPNLGGGASEHARRVAEGAFGRCLEVLGRVKEAEQIIARRAVSEAAEAHGTGGVVEDEQAAVALKESEYRAGDAAGEIVADELWVAWQLIQEECQVLLCALLQTPAPPAGGVLGQSSGGEPSPLQADGISSKFGRLFARSGSDRSVGGSPVASPRAAPRPSAADMRLSFSFEFSEAASRGPGGSGGTASSPTRSSGPTSPGPIDPPGTYRGLGLPAGGAYLAPVVLQPTMEFVRAAEECLAAAKASPSRGGGSIGATDLRGLMRWIVSDVFVPRVKADLRARIEGSLQPDAMRPRARARAPYDADPAKGRPLLPAAVAAEEAMGQLVAWGGGMPVAGSQLVEVVAGLLSRVLEGLRAAAMFASSGSWAEKLLARQDVQAILAVEPAIRHLNVAALTSFRGGAGQPVGLERLLSRVNSNPGGEAGGEEAEVDEEAESRLLDILWPTARSGEIQKGHLVSDRQKLATLAALSDSLDFVADCADHLRETLPKQADGGIGDEGGDLEDALSILWDMARMYRSLGWQCLQTLRAGLVVDVAFHLHELEASDWCEGAEQQQHETDGAVLALLKAVTQVEEEVAPYLPSNKRAYLFSTLPSYSAQCMMRALRGMPEINGAGIRKICSCCIALQQGLVPLGSRDTYGSTVAVMQTRAMERLGSKKRIEGIQASFERVQKYYQLLDLSVDTLLGFIEDNPMAFRPAELAALLDARVPGRVVTDAHRRRLETLTGWC